MTSWRQGARLLDAAEIYLLFETSKNWLKHWINLHVIIFKIAFTKKQLESNAWSFNIFSCFVFNSAFVANVTSFVFKSEFFTRSEILDLSTNPFSLFCINHFTPKFIIIRRSNGSNVFFFFNVGYSSVIILTKSLTSDYSLNL